MIGWEGELIARDFMVKEFSSLVSRSTLFEVLNFGEFLMLTVITQYTHLQIINQQAAIRSNDGKYQRAWRRPPDPK